MTKDKKSKANDQPQEIPLTGAVINPLPIALQDDRSAAASQPLQEPAKESADSPKTTKAEAQDVQSAAPLPADTQVPPATVDYAPPAADDDLRLPPSTDTDGQLVAPPSDSSGQSTISDAQAVVAAQIEAAARNLDAGPSDVSPDAANQQQNGYADAQPSADSYAAQPAPQQDLPDPNHLYSQPDSKQYPADPSGIGQAIELDQVTAPPAQAGQYEPADPYTANPYAQQQKRSRANKHGYKRLIIGGSIVSVVLIFLVGFGAFSVWYVKNRVYSSVSYTNYQSVSVKGAAEGGGFVIDVPTEYSQDHKTDNSVEYSHRVPTNKGSGNYSGVAVNTTEITDENQLGEISKLKDILRDKNSGAAQQFVSLINGSLSGEQNVSLESFIEKTNTFGQEFFGYEIALKQDANNVGKGWMLITTSEKHIYVLVLYGTNQVWEENPDTWQYVFDSLQVAATK